MLLSMTGHGRAIVENENAIVVVEIRAVNNRFLKASVHADLPGGSIARIESLIKEHVARGTVSVKVRQQWLSRPSQFQLDLEVLEAYQNQLESRFGAVSVSDLLGLPGIVSETLGGEQEDANWPAIESAVLEAIGKFNEMRASEGEVTAADLRENCKTISEELSKIEAQAPRVVEHYAKRLTERIQQMLQTHDLQVDEVSVVREVGIFSDRADISEEIVRLGNHVQQFLKIIEMPISNGRKLDFLSQEMLRETNTIGSKANDATIAASVVEIKTAIERIREQVQNVE